ncbi:nitrile hydratase subunit beta [Mycolicibacterium litorale]|uniref:Nitrile hydratase subunit beta n=1 Tax=Mycolicibacterium litorale TaxID=758802 RepID=A0AAD1MUL1_9MYCO|nr:nitrile hydratase subunit beta [Mycolicibacterium litorale]MCV7415965.1 nitrile hydratase subunit beta [Mycolicibacterium litorale]TDY09218.1 nitrile hydratase [Mycolicibacterium litorale]BBY17158.1 nitrile hydratase [Mycolicibacterium litorale]
MDGIADMGGTEGWGRAQRPQPDEPVFPEPWHGRAFALSLLANRLAGGNLDSFRHALERLDRGAYLDDGYFGRWLNGAERILTENDLLASSAVDARARTLRGERVEEPPSPQPAAREARSAAPGSRREVQSAPAFAVGQRVRAKNLSPAGHTRLPRYVRGHTGVVTLVEPAFVFPDTNAHFRGEDPQYVYTVAFDSRELWGEDTEPFTLTIEMFESYLEEAG